jgi:hypothetical protein
MTTPAERYALLAQAMPSPFQSLLVTNDYIHNDPSADALAASKAQNNAKCKHQAIFLFSYYTLLLYSNQPKFLTVALAFLLR